VKRSEMKCELNCQLGALFAELDAIADNPDAFSTPAKEEALARYNANNGALRKNVIKFSKPTPNLEYRKQRRDFSHAIRRVADEIERLSFQALPEVVNQGKEKAKKALNSIPATDDLELLKEKEPFTAYCAIRNLFCNESTKSILWIDPYLKECIFHRFLRGVGRDVDITLVTRAVSPTADPEKRRARQEFLDVSNLFAQEHAGRYTLLTRPHLHDRKLVVDDTRFYLLGGSAKDAGKKSYFTIMNRLLSFVERN